MKWQTWLALIVPITFWNTGCGPNSDDDAQSSNTLLSRTEWINCHNAAAVWSLETIEAALLGNWKTIGANCPTNVAEGLDTSTNYIAATFFADGTMEIYESGTLVHSANWELDAENIYGIDIKLDPFAWQIDGIPYFCEGKLMLVAPLDDGCWTYLERP